MVSTVTTIMKYTELLQEIGFSRNEARIYETLLGNGELGVGAIAEKSGVHRRNVYDTLNRLTEKGIAFEVLDQRENRYQAVPPEKLLEFLEEKENTFRKKMPEMQDLYRLTPQEHKVYILRGIEGWKSYMRDILRVGADDYIVGAKGVWSDPKLEQFAVDLGKKAEKSGIAFHILYEHENIDKVMRTVDMLKPTYRFLPKGFETSSAFEVFGDHIVFISDSSDGLLHEEIELTVVVNQKLADSFRTWFKLLWSISAVPKPSKKV